MVSTAWENGEMAVLRDLLEPHQQYFAGMFCSTHDQEIAEMVEVSIRTLASWLHQPASGTDMDVQVALGVLKHLAQDRPSASLVM